MKHFKKKEKEKNDEFTKKKRKKRKKWTLIKTTKRYWTKALRIYCYHRKYTATTENIQIPYFSMDGHSEQAIRRWFYGMDRNIEN